ncbi:hypothetical protein MACH21_11130 [Roseicyclus marinus]|uniref:Uncharacterized protein n=1 Tax=Roseicyclus marinus TaxID=2161673 RepID=A0AA48HIQ3_9RHOB|nr:hypothetical protein MACH21_11130 [Roseicyclus marinus]
MPIKIAPTQSDGSLSHGSHISDWFARAAPISTQAKAPATVQFLNQPDIEDIPRYSSHHRMGRHRGC